MKILIVGGFLGSGKTSIILNIARYLTQEKHMQLAVLENEIGEIGIDDKILAGSGLQVRGLFAGCVCCTLAGELPVTVREIEREIAPDLLIIETTGVAFPYDVRDNLLNTLELPSDVLCVVDAQRWNRLFKPMETLFTHQLKGADTVFINKADLADEETQDLVEKSVKAMAPGAALYRTNADTDLPEDAMQRIAEEVTA